MPFPFGHSLRDGAVGRNRTGPPGAAHITAQSVGLQRAALSPGAYQDGLSSGSGPTPRITVALGSAAQFRSQPNGVPPGFPLVFPDGSSELSS